MANPLSQAKSNIRKITNPPRLPKPPSMSQVLAQAQRGVKGAFKPTPARSRTITRIKWNKAAFRELRLEPGVQNYIDQLAAEIAARAGDGYEVSHWDGKNRARASVYTDTFDARRENARNQTLLRALG